MIPYNRLFYLLISMTISSTLFFNFVYGQNNFSDFNQETASRLADIPMNCLQKEYPNKLNQVSLIYPVEIMRENIGLHHLLF
jgi:hypothetical protein